MDQVEYLKFFAKQLVQETESILRIKQATRNSALLGSFTEAAVRRLAHRVVQTMRICTGAVVNHPMPVELRQVDLIVWAPNPAPAIFELEGFGFVPRSSAFGVLEIKLSNYSAKAVQSIATFLDDVKTRSIVSDSAPSIIRDHDRTPGLGVICVLDKPISKKLNNLLDSGEVVAIWDMKAGDATPRSKDIIALVNFLFFVTWRYRVATSSPNYIQISTSGL